jgi:NADH-quinone oxidoreductase subunit G
MVTLYIENKAYTVKPDQNLLHACLSLGFNIPYFCWHPAMHSVGACRQCAVKEFKDDKDTRGRIVMSCMTPVKDGMRISIEDPEAKSFRKSIVELLMLNHPHDCPVCDEGGECHLQDMTVMTGHAYRRTTFKKRSYLSQDLGPFVAHEMNRCIQCYRCVRFYRDYAGGRDLDVFAAHDHVYFGRQRDGVLESEFSGNLAEICPTGVFTDKTFQKHYTRTWDLQNAPSICVHCGVGCNTIPGERYKMLRRIRARYNGEVNKYFLCDRGRFGYEFVNGETRIREPLLQKTAVTANHALARVRDILSGSKGVVGIGSPRASLESNFALRTLVGTENFYTGMPDRELAFITLIITILQNGPARSPSLNDVQSCDAVLVLGEDVTNTAPILALALRQAARNTSIETAQRQHIPAWDDAAVRNATQGMKGNFTVAAPYSTKLDRIASRLYHASPDNIARFGFAVAKELNSGMADVAGLDQETRALAAAVAKDLKSAKNPLIVSGISLGSDAVIGAAANIAWALCGPGKKAGLSYVVPECNSLGMALMAGKSLGSAVQIVAQGKADTVIVLENDLYRRIDGQTADALFRQAKHSIMIDHTLTSTASCAEVVLPAATFAESDGTFVNLEGRAQRFYQVFVPKGDTQESWRWLRDMMTATGRAGGSSWEGLDDVIASLAVSMPQYSAIPDIAPPAGFRIAGMKIPRQPHRFSGRTAMFANGTLSEPRPPRDSDSALAFTMEGYPGIPPSPLIPRFWAAGWNSPQAINKFQSEVGGPLQGGDPGIRLIEPGSADPEFFRNIPPAWNSGSDWLIVHAYHLFGSDEMSILSPGIAELAPKPYAGVNLALPEQHHFQEGDEIRIEMSGSHHVLTVRHIEALPKGVLVIPAGLPGGKVLDLPARGTVTKTAASRGARP